jgi:hypothetical protein
MKNFFLAVAICCLLFVFLTSCKKTDNSVIKSPNVKINEKKGTDTDEADVTETTVKVQDGNASKSTDHTPADSKFDFSGKFVEGDELLLTAFDDSVAVFTVVRGDKEFEIRKKLSDANVTLIGSIGKDAVCARFGPTNVNVFVGGEKSASFPISKKKHVSFKLVKKPGSNKYTFS